MSESEGRVREHDPKAGRILALHAEHRDGLHTTPAPDCIQCTFDGLMHPNGDEVPAVPDPDTA
ncbi:MAG TPA: hypothetical protein VIA82_04845 [Candidatus Limnocylindria bacterium]